MSKSKDNQKKKFLAEKKKTTESMANRLPLLLLLALPGTAGGACSRHRTRLARAQAWTLAAPWLGTPPWDGVAASCPLAPARDIYAKADAQVRNHKDKDEDRI